MGKNQFQAAEDENNIKNGVEPSVKKEAKPKKESDDFDPQKALGVGTVMMKRKAPFYKRVVTAFSKGIR